MTTLPAELNDWLATEESRIDLVVGPAGGGATLSAWLIEQLGPGIDVVDRVANPEAEVPLDGRAVILQPTGHELERIPGAAPIIEWDLLDLVPLMKHLLESQGVAHAIADHIAANYSPGTQLVDAFAGSRGAPLAEQVIARSIVQSLLVSIAGDGAALDLGRVLLLMYPQEVVVADEWYQLATALSGRPLTSADISHCLLRYPWLFAREHRRLHDIVRPRNPLARTILTGVVPISDSEHHALYRALRRRALDALISNDDADEFIARQLPRQAMASGSFRDLFQDPLSILCSDPISLVREIEKDSMLPVHPGAKAVLLAAYRLMLGTDRASSLELAALRVGLRDFANTIAVHMDDRPWRTVWARAQPVNANRTVFSHPAPVLCIAAAATGVCAMGTSDGQAWSVSPYGTPSLVWDGTEIAGEVRGIGIACSPRADVICIATSDQRILGVNLESHLLLWENRVAHSAPPSCLATSNGKDALVATSGVDGRICVVDAISGDPVGEVFTHTRGGVPIEVRALEFARRGDRLLLWFCAVDGLVGALDPTSGRLIWSVRQDLGVLIGLSVATSADSTSLLLGSSTGGVHWIEVDETAAPWGASDPTEVVRHRAAVNDVHWASDASGRVALSASSDRTWRWTPIDGSSGSSEAAIEGHFGPLWSIITVEAEGQRLVATAGGDGTARVWVPEAVIRESLALEKPTRHSGPITTVAFLPGSEPISVLTGGADGDVRHWSTEGTASGRPWARERGSVGAIVVTASEDNDEVSVFSGSSSGELHRTDTVDGLVVRRTLLGVVHDGITALTRTTIAGRTVLASAGADGAVMTWNLETEEPNGSRRISHYGPVTALCSVGERNGSSLLVTASQQGAVSFLRADDLEEQMRFEHPAPITSLAPLPYHSAGTIAGLANGEIQVVRDARRGDRWQTIGCHSSDVTGVGSLVVGGRLVVVSISLGRELMLWDVSTRVLLQRIELDGVGLSLDVTQSYVLVGTTAGAAVFDFTEDPLVLAAPAR